MERILWLLSGSDSHLTKMLMERFSVSKSLMLPEDLHRKVSSSRTWCRVCVCKEIYRYQLFSTLSQNKKIIVESFQPKI